jgi:hypothetical protein
MCLSCLCGRMPGAISSLISISVEGLGLCGLCVSELCVSPVLCFSELWDSQTVLIHREGASFMQDHYSSNFTYGISLRINEPLKQDRCELI